MAYPELTVRAGFAAKVESPSGVDASPTAASDAIRLLGATEPQTGYLSENSRDDLWTGALDSLAPISPGGRYHRFDIAFIPIGAAAVYSASVLPECAAILRAAGYSQAVDTTGGAEKVTYSLAGDPATTITAQLELSGKKYKTIGTIVESLSIALVAAQFPICRATLVGIAVDPAEQTLEAHTYDNVDALPIWRGAGAFVLSGYSPIIHSANINLGIEATPRAAANATEGHLGYRMTRRRATLDFIAEVEALSTWNPYADWHAATLRTLDILAGLAGGPGQYKRVRLDADDVRYMNVRDQDSNGMRVYNPEMKIALPASGNVLNWVFD